MWALWFWTQLLTILQQTLLCTKPYMQSSDFCFKILPHQKRTDGRGMERAGKTNTSRWTRYLYGKGSWNPPHGGGVRVTWIRGCLLIKGKLEARGRRLTDVWVGLKRGGSCITQKMGLVVLLSVITKCKEETCLLDKNMVSRGVRSLSKS